MDWSFLLAHGVLGSYDELILPIIGLIFIGLIVFTWFKSRGNEDPEASASQSTPENLTSQEPNDDSHFRLD